MSAGFGEAGNDAKVIVDFDKVVSITKQYKKLKKYMKSNYYNLLIMNGTENIVTNLVNKYSEDTGDP